jgi:hypothetical protein
MPTMATPAVGSRVKLSLIGREVWATVIEDRGPLAGGAKLLRVRLDWPQPDPIEFELPALDVSSPAA